ncbi:hypothetical protein Hypma_000562 [Hypsizygus marmoreus]|uniref:Uncharacterized protein n=1 Tax=Hypsizygus marmoreus TaxID=39966 RepID=A0A369JA03_HYPMA|nr:hypothetical protein Hypma_000562 [Hypsizygus marmoreus]
MSEAVLPEGPARGRGRGKSRGGLGKYLRARGRGRGLGRPAVFTERLVLEGEKDDEEDGEEAAEKARKFSRRQLGSNIDRYLEPEPELGSDGEPLVEPEVDLSSFLERQKISDAGPSLPPLDDDDADVDATLAHISSQSKASASSKKGRVEQIEWDEELDELSRDKASAEATWELKSRFRAKAERLRGKPTQSHPRKTGSSYIDAPALPLPDGSVPVSKNPKDDMQDFLDDLLG